METPIMINPSAIKGMIWKNCAITGIICFIFGYIMAFIAMDQRIMNRPIVEYIRKVTVIEQHLPTNYFAPTGEWLSKGDPVALTPVKEK